MRRIKGVLRITRIIGLIFFVIALVIAILLSMNIYDYQQDGIKKEQQIVQIKDKLFLIRDLQTSFQLKYKTFAPDWRSLQNFADKDKFYITERRERVIRVTYSGDEEAVTLDSIVVSNDTIKTIPVRDSLLSHSNYSNLNLDDLSSIPGSDYKFELKVELNENFQSFLVTVTDPEIEKVKHREEGLVPYAIGALDRPSTKGNWEK